MSTLIHLLLDLENVQPSAKELEHVRGPHYRLWILHGPHQNDFTADRVRAWQPLGEQVRFVQCMKAGKNALDLHVAFCIGEASERDRQQKAAACYIIVSNDKGFDALFGYLGGLGTKVARAESLALALTMAGELAGKSKRAGAPKAMSVSANAERALKDLREHPRNRPRTEKRLHNHLGSLLGPDVAVQEISRVVAELKAVSALDLEGTKVKYGTAIK